MIDFRRVCRRAAANTSPCVSGFCCCGRRFPVGCVLVGISYHRRFYRYRYRYRDDGRCFVGGRRWFVPLCRNFVLVLVRGGGGDTFLVGDVEEGAGRSTLLHSVLGLSF